MQHATNRLLSWAAAVLLGCAVGPSVLAADRERDMDVNVQIVGEEIRTAVTLFVRAPQQRVWDVVTDYERAPEFMKDVQSSRILSRAGDRLRLEQKDQVRFGPFTFPVESVREVREVEPTRTESHLVSGSMKKYDSVMELVPENGGTKIVYRSVTIPDSSLARLAGESTAKRITEERFKQLRAEILRREVVATRR
jgi:hypothetical protein